MPTYLDESGDTGVGARCSPYFRLAAVWFERFADADRFARDIARVRQDVLNVGLDFEFHFTHLSHDQRLAFLAAAAGHPFGYVVSSLDKSKYGPRELTKRAVCEATIGAVTAHLHEWYLLAEACKGGPDGPAPLSERVVYDESYDPVYIKRLTAGFRGLGSDRKAGAKLVKSVKIGKSKADPCLQLADMICGAVRRRQEGDDSYYRLIRGKEIRVVDLP